MEKLNQYVLLEIFEYLDGASLKNCSATCSSWAELIGSSKATMEKLPLFIDNDRVKKEKLDEMKTLKRQFYSLIIDEIRMTNTVMTPLKSHIENIRVLELIQIDHSEASWNTLLKNLSSIEKIIIVECTLTPNKKVKTDRYKIPTLRSLTIIDCEWSLFDYIAETAVEVLKVQSRHFYNYEKVIFSRFLKMQKFITSMAIRINQILFYKSLVIDEKEEGGNVNFRLKNLAISFKHFSDENNAKVLLDVLEQNKSTLESLEVDCKLNDKTLEYIFTKLNLKSLRLNASHLPKETVVFYNSIQPNRFLKKLVLTGDFNSHTASQGLFHIYRNVEDLAIFNWSPLVANDILLSIINNLTKISHLRIPFLVETVPEISMPSLKHLHIDSINKSDDLHSMLMNQSNLERLSVKWINDDINNVISNDMIQLKKLQHVTFGPGFNPTHQTLRALKQKCQNLRTLELFYDFNCPIAENILNEMNGSQFKSHQLKNEAASRMFTVEKGMWYDEDKFYTCLSRHSVETETELDSMSSENDDFGFDDSDDDYDDYDSDFGNPFYGYSDSDGDFEDYMLHEVINFLIN